MAGRGLRPHASPPRKLSPANLSGILDWRMRLRGSNDPTGEVLRLHVIVRTGEASKNRRACPWILVRGGRGARLDKFPGAVINSSMIWTFSYSSTMAPLLDVTLEIIMHTLKHLHGDKSLWCVRNVPT